MVDGGAALNQHRANVSCVVYGVLRSMSSMRSHDMIRR